MITIRNNGKKIVHIAKTALMPGEEMHTADIVGDTPAIKVFAKHGILAITPYVEEPVATETKAEATSAEPESTADAVAEEAPAPKKRGRKPATTTETEKEAEAE